MGESIFGEPSSAKRARLLASLFEHPAWASEPDAAAAVETAGAVAQVGVSRPASPLPVIGLE